MEALFLTSVTLACMAEGEGELGNVYMLGLVSLFTDFRRHDVTCGTTIELKWKEAKQIKNFNIINIFC